MKKPLKISISTPTRIAIGLTGFLFGCLLIVLFLGMIPDAVRATSEGRCALAESVAVQCCLAAQRDDVKTMRAVLTELVQRNDSIISAAIRRRNGDLAVDVGDHRARWQASAENPRPGAQLKVPIYQGARPWGELELCCVPLGYGGWLDSLWNPTARLILVLGGSAFLVNLLYLRRVLRLLNPKAVVPDRVRATLDTLSEGVMILDNQQQIVLANKAFAERLGKTPDSMQGLKPSEFGWSNPGGESLGETLPWIDAILKGKTQTGVLLRVPGQGDAIRTLSVNSIPIIGGRGERRGALATFDDVTVVEQQNIELSRMLYALKESRDEIQRQNCELFRLATFDPLTQCLNRRSFFEQLEIHWTRAVKNGLHISFLMVDVDNFKSVNDRFGHSTGDVVLQKVGEALRARARESDLVCRYGGEEFCILLPHMHIEQAAAAAEHYRVAIESMRFERFSITASFGIAAYAGRETTAQELLELADRSLYAAKQRGRNRVVRGDQLDPAVMPKPPAPAPAPVVASAIVSTATTLTEHAARPKRDDPKPIDMHLVRALSSAMAHRDTMTAHRSRQTADLCVLVSKDLLAQHARDELEVAALLHDIGKIGIPDSILLKPGALTEEEWKVMRTHIQIGVNILSAASASGGLLDIARTHHAWYGGTPHDSSLPRDESIPLGGRVLAIAEAFVAMVSDCRYRKARTPEEAFAELRLAAGTQFDPQLVERFIQVVSCSDQSRQDRSSTISSQTALDIGLHSERLAGALDAQDFTTMSAIAAHLALTAARGGAAAVAGLAAQVEQAAAAEPDLMEVVQLTSELLDLCREMQRSHLPPEIQHREGNPRS